MDRILTNGLFLKDETEKKNSSKWTLSAKEDQTNQKYFKVHIFAPNAVI